MLASTRRYFFLNFRRVDGAIITAFLHPGFAMSCTSLMVQGTTTDAGKSTLVAALCRILKRRGVNVAPFKPQNMALNSAVTVDGGEIGRAQALQALACGLAPHTDFNPVLLKPTTDRKAQVIIHGKVAFDLDAKAYHAAGDGGGARILGAADGGLRLRGC